MTTTVFLVRHASHDLLGRVLAGRSKGVHLSAQGRQEAGAVARYLADRDLAAVQSSPLERAQETAEAIAAPHGLRVVTEPALDEIDFGAWCGARFDALEGDPAWRYWNQSRHLARAPGGESMLEAQSRAVGHIRSLADLYPDAAVALVSHQDVIKAVLACILGIPLQALERFEVAPASVSALALGDWGANVLSMNQTVPV